MDYAVVEKLLKPQDAYQWMRQFDRYGEIHWGNLIGMMKLQIIQYFTSNMYAWLCKHYWWIWCGSRSHGTGQCVRGNEGWLRRIQMVSYLHLCWLNMRLAKSGIYSFHGSGAIFISEHKSSRRLSYSGILPFSELIFYCGWVVFPMR
jgi:hypothetical protein